MCSYCDAYLSMDATTEHEALYSEHLSFEHGMES